MTGRIAVMATTPVEMGPIGDRVAANVAALRRAAQLQQRDLSERLAAVGRTLAPSALSKIEKLDRRVDVDDLVALAIALGVNPNRLLLPERAGGDEVSLTPTAAVSEWEAWAWADGRFPLSVDTAGQPQSGVTQQEVEDFRRRARPVDLQLRESHPAMRAARDVSQAIDQLLRTAHLRREAVTEDDYVSSDRLIAEETPGRLRSALDQLASLVADLLDAEPAENTALLTSGTSRVKAQPQRARRVAKGDADGPSLD